jgi:protein farnesyltransferase subunit beta
MDKDMSRDLANVITDEKHNDDGNPSQTTEDQVRVEDDVSKSYGLYLEGCELSGPVLKRAIHSAYLRRGLVELTANYQHLDASRPWLIYWILHSLELLDEPVDIDMKSHIVNFLNRCQNESGGYGGGPGQISHLAVTYAAVSALCILGTEEAYRSINRAALQWFIARMLQRNGSFRSHDGGEVDIRGAYVALAVARLVNILSPEICEGTAAWVASCQTYEGGFGGIPGGEAHGGYTYCGAAALILLGTTHLCDIQVIIR